MLNSDLSKYAPVNEDSANSINKSEEHNRKKSQTVLFIGLTESSPKDSINMPNSDLSKCAPVIEDFPNSVYMESYYNSDEEIAWGPVTIREIKGDFKRAAKYRKPNKRHTVIGGGDLGNCKICKTPNESLKINSNSDLLEKLSSAVNTSNSDLSICASVNEDSANSINKSEEHNPKKSQTVPFIDLTESSPKDIINMPNSDLSKCAPVIEDFPNSVYMESYYSSDEEIAWGPVTIREIKGDFKRAAKYRKPNKRHTVIGGGDLGNCKISKTPNESLKTNSNSEFLEKLSSVVNTSNSDLSKYSTVNEDSANSINKSEERNPKKSQTVQFIHLTESSPKDSINMSNSDLSKYASVIEDSPNSRSNQQIILLQTNL